MRFPKMAKIIDIIEIIEIIHRRVKCDICDQEICNKLLLKRHKAKVHGIKPDNVHQCEYCPLFFSIKVFLAKQLAKKHPEITKMTKNCPKIAKNCQ